MKILAKFFGITIIILINYNLIYENQSINRYKNKDLIFTENNKEKFNFGEITDSIYKILYKDSDPKDIVKKIIN